jgi:hypothetical protein
VRVLGYFTHRARRAWSKSAPSPAVKPVVGRVYCREITPEDIQRVIKMLTKGLQRPLEFWLHVMHVLATHDTPEGYPKYGFLLENDGVAVGVLLMIFTARVENGVTFIQCSESSYYVDPAFRFYASLLVQRGHRFKEVTYLDVTAAPTRYSTLEMQGYKRIGKTVYASFPALCRPVTGAQVRRVESTFFDTRLKPTENDLLRRHATYRMCIPLIVEHNGAVYPFVFVVRRIRGIPYLFLIYTRNSTDFTTFAGPIGRFLAKRLHPVVMLDVDEPIAVPGKLVGGNHRKYWKGAREPRVGDLAYTEIAMFGV